MRVTLVLSGGGAKSLAHLGAWRALSEANLLPSHIVATSFGAVIGAALAAGQTPDQVLGAMRSLDGRGIASLDPWVFVKGIFSRAILKPDGLRKVIERLVPVERFEDLKLPVTVTATDLDSGELVLFGCEVRGAGLIGLREALYASCALPLYFPPAVIDGRRLVDGGIRAVLPLEPAATIPADLVVAVNVGPGFDDVLPSNLPPSSIPSLIRAHGESERIMMAAQTERMIAAWPASAPRLIVVRAVMEREATFAVDRIARYIEAGYTETQCTLRK